MSDLSSKTLAKWPERIYLQRDYECAEEGCGPHSGDDGETTWCKDKIHDTDVEYVRADLARVSDEPPAVDVAPIAKLTVRDGLVQRAGLYAPGLPDGDHDVFPVPLSPKGELRPHVLAEPPSAWQPIETAPKLGKWVLLWWPAITDAAFVGYCVDGVWKAATSGDKWPGIDGPTHWMPLPAGPAVTKDPVLSGINAAREMSGLEPFKQAAETEATQVTTYEVGETSGVCKHCGLSWLLHIAEDDRGRKNVCAPIKRAESETPRHE